MSDYGIGCLIMFLGAVFYYFFDYLGMTTEGILAWIFSILLFLILTVSEQRRGKDEQSLLQ